MRGDRDRLEANDRYELQRFEEVMPRPADNPHAGVGPKPFGEFGVEESSSGSANAVRRREFLLGDEGDRVDDNTRGRAEQKARCEKLNDESPTKGLPVRRRRDVAETRKGSRRRVGGQLVVSSPRNLEALFEETAPSWKVRTYGETTRSTKPLAT